MKSRRVCVEDLGRPLLAALPLARAGKPQAAVLTTEHLRQQRSPQQRRHVAMRLAGVADTGSRYPIITDIEHATILAAINAGALTLRDENGRMLARSTE